MSAHFQEIEGLFGPASEIWRVNRERVVLLGGPAAAVLQVAHPQVARGVANHSQFRHDPIGRLSRTLDAMYAVAFGDREAVEAVRRGVAAMHAKVRGPGYSAFDPGAQLWVMATLIMGSVQMFQRFVGTLTASELDAFLAENARTGKVFGLDPNHLPQPWAAFEKYYQSMVHGGELGSDPLCAEMAHEVLHPRTPVGMRVLSPVFQALASELLPEDLIVRLRLGSSALRRPVWGALDALLPALIPHLPSTWRFPLPYRLACQRCAALDPTIEHLIQ